MAGPLHHHNPRKVCQTAAEVGPGTRLNLPHERVYVAEAAVGTSMRRKRLPYDTDASGLLGQAGGSTVHLREGRGHCAHETTMGKGVRVSIYPQS